MNKFISALGGKKSLWVILIVLLGAFKETLGLSENELMAMAGSLGLVGAGQGIADAGSKGKTSHQGK